MEAGTQRPQLRPLNFGEILDVAINVVLKNARTLITAVAVVVVPVTLLSAIVQLSAFPDAFDPGQQSAITTGSGEDLMLDSSAVAVAVGAFVVTGLFSVLASLLATAACFRAIATAYVGGQPGWRESLSFAFRRLGSLLLLLVLVTLAFTALGVVVVLLGLAGPAAGVLALLVAFVAFVYLGVAWSVSIPALLVEDARNVSALRRSFQLIRKRWWPAFGILVVGVLITFVIGLVIGLISSVPLVAAPDSTIVNFAAQTVGGLISSLVTTPILAAFITILYFDLRVRKEGLDLRLIAERIDASPEQAERGSPYIRPAGPPATAPGTAPPAGTPEHTGAWAPPAGATGGERASGPGPDPPASDRPPSTGA